jgi:Flp pilus assembly protein TadG
MKKAQAMVEFALVLGVFLFLLVVMIDWGYYLYSLSVLNSAARDAARTASTYIDLGTNLEGASASVNILIAAQTAGLSSDLRAHIAGKTTLSIVNDAKGKPVSVTVSIADLKYKPIMGFANILVPQEINLQSTMRYERG